MCANIHDKTNIDGRLATIEGHIRGVRQMVAEGKNCDEVLLQLTAIRGAIDKLAKVVLIDHANICVRRAVEEKDLEEYSHFVEVLSKYL